MIYIVGIGPGSKEYLTLKALEAVKNADVIVGSRRALDLFNLTNLNDKNKEVIILTKNVVDDLKRVIKMKNSQNYHSKDIVILSTGDPCFSGLLKTILKFNIKKDDIEVIPGVSSIQIAAARLKISWEDYDIITLHGKEENRKKLLDLMKNRKKVIFLPNNLKKDIKYLIDNGIDPNTEIWVLENLTYNNERIIKKPLKDLINKKFSYLCVCVYGHF